MDGVNNDKIYHKVTKLEDGTTKETTLLFSPPRTLTEHAQAASACVRGRTAAGLDAIGENENKVEIRSHAIRASRTTRTQMPVDNKGNPLTILSTDFEVLDGATVPIQMFAQIRKKRRGQIDDQVLLPELEIDHFLDTRAEQCCRIRRI